MASKFKYIRYYITYSEFRPSTKKVCSSDVKHCLISIFELKVMVKIGVIFMSFSNPTCHFRDTADFTVCTVCTLCNVLCCYRIYFSFTRTTLRFVFGFYSFFRCQQLVFDWFSALRNSSQDLGIYFERAGKFEFQNYN